LEFSVSEILCDGAEKRNAARAAEFEVNEMTVSIAVIVKNEAVSISRCFESVKWADEVIVLDPGSIDDTFSICREYTPHVHGADWPGFELQKKQAGDHGELIPLHLGAGHRQERRREHRMRPHVVANRCEGVEHDAQMHKRGKK